MATVTSRELVERRERIFVEVDRIIEGRASRERPYVDLEAALDAYVAAAAVVARARPSTGPSTGSGGTSGRTGAKPKVPALSLENR